MLPVSGGESVAIMAGRHDIGAVTNILASVREREETRSGLAF